MTGRVVDRPPVRSRAWGGRPGSSAVGRTASVVLLAAMLGACAGQIPGPFAPPLGTTGAVEAAAAPPSYPNINNVPVPPSGVLLTPPEQAEAAARLRELGDAAEKQARNAEQGGQADAAALRRRAELLRRCSVIVDPAALPAECRNL